MTSGQEQPLAAFTMISRPRWMWLLILTLAVIALLLYGFLGSVPKAVRGVGLTRTHLDLYTVAAPQSGIIEKIHIEIGSKIALNTPIFSLTAKVFEVQMQSARDRLALLRSEDEDLTATSESTLAETRRRLESSISEAKKSIEDSTELLDLRKSLLDEQEKLLQQGFVAKETVLGTRTTVASLRSEIESARTSIAASRLEATQSEATIAQARSGRRGTIQQAEAAIQKFEKQQRNDYTIRSVVAGTVLEISTAVGDPVSEGEELIVVEPEGVEDGVIDVVAFLPQRKAKELEVGDAVQVSPSFASRSRYGFMKGTLTSIDLYAATDGELERFIQSSSMITDLEQKYQSVLVAKVKLERDPRTESGLAWSTRDGWPGTISPGTILDLQVIFEVDRPIDLLLPWLRSLIGE